MGKKCRVLDFANILTGFDFQQLLWQILVILQRQFFKEYLGYKKELVWRSLNIFKMLIIGLSMEWYYGDMHLDKFPSNSFSCFEDQMRENSVFLFWKCLFHRQRNSVGGCGKRWHASIGVIMLHKWTKIQGNRLILWSLLLCQLYLYPMLNKMGSQNSR